MNQLYLDGEYNYFIVILSIMFIISTTYISLNIASQIVNKSFRHRFFHVLLGTIVLGGGIWAFHLISMLAFRLDVAMSYQLKYTILSMLVSIGLTYVFFVIISKRIISKTAILLATFFLSTNIVATHFIGMKALEVPAMITYQRPIIIISVVFTFVTVYVGLLLFERHRQANASSVLKWYAPLFLGAAIIGLHYASMKGTSYYVDSTHIVTEYALDFMLLFGITISIIVLFIFTWILLYYDRIQLERMAYKDPLTNLYNRHKMNQMFERYINEEQIGILFLDLDKFRLINESLGHYNGDKIIKTVANRLKKFENKYKKAYRIGGDEFLFIVKEATIEDMNCFAVELLTSIKAPFLINSSKLHLKSSIGMSVGTVHEANPMKLLHEADMAMYHAKKHKTNSFLLYHPAIGAQESRRIQLTTDIQMAVQEEELFLLYQAQWNVLKEEVFGFEALLRWEHPELGLISPTEFIPVAEKTGEIIPITYWVVEQVCQQLKQWQDEALDNPVSVNISSHLFQTGNFVENIKAIIMKANIEPQFLELEITESTALHDTHEVREQIEQIRQLGVRVSMDDFGVGYSSIGLLDQIPLDSLKLDRSFTIDLNKRNKQTIIKAILLMAETLQLDVIVEGVETKEQLDLYSELGCEIIQGFYFYKPYTVEKINEWLLEID